MDIKVLALDLDGTLTNSEKKITLNTKETLQRAMEDGVTVVLASGRPLVGIKPLAKELELSKYSGYILAYNGGQIIDCHTGKEVYQKVLNVERIASIYEVAKQFGLAMLTYDGEDIITEDDTDPYVLRECFINKVKVRKIEDIVSHVTYPVPKCLVVGEHEKLLPVRDYLNEKYGDELSIYFSEPFFLEIMPLGVEKSASLELLLNRLQLSREELMACGDGFNDITMLQYAGLGVAMGNACKEAKEVSDYVTATNDEDGVAKAVDRFILSGEKMVG
jgi:Cof subfamily protein (haloacid dehalogenase superfamily)